MRRRIARPFGSSIPGSRALSMLIGLAVLWTVYDAIRQPAAWSWLAAEDAEVHSPVGPGGAGSHLPVDEEIVVPGPNDLEPDIWQDFQSREELMKDRAPLIPREMIAYWQLLGWTRTQSFQELEQRAIQKPVLTQIWEEPQKYRGKPVRLRLHVRRVLEHETDPSKNPLGAKKVYEAMGWTDESKSLPYTVVFTERPSQLPVGPEVEAEVVFVGYFVKIMTYTAFDDTRRGTPLLAGRVRMVAKVVGQPPVSANPWELVGLVAGGGIVTALVFWFMPRKKRPRLGSSSVIDLQASFDGTLAAPPTDVAPDFSTPITLEPTADHLTPKTGHAD